VKHIVGIDLGTNLGVARLFMDGRAEALTYNLGKELEDRLRGLHGIIKRHASPDCLGVCIEEPFGEHKAALRTLYSMMGVALFSCDQVGLPYSRVHLMTLKKHITGSGKARKPEMIQAMRDRFGLELDENSADALSAACFAMDTEVFVSMNEKV
jgi:Holliday junction resolvasome RuvABC endonuclease subunit